MDEVEKYQQRLQAIAEKRRLQEEEERTKRQLEDEKLRLQQLKRKSLRDQWLMEGPPLSSNSAGPLSPPWGTPAQQIEEHIDKLQSEIIDRTHKHKEDGSTSAQSHTDHHGNATVNAATPPSTGSSANGQVKSSASSHDASLSNGTAAHQKSHNAPPQHVNDISKGVESLLFLGYTEAEPGQGLCDEDDDDDVSAVIRAERVVIMEEGEEVTRAMPTEEEEVEEREGGGEGKEEEREKGQEEEKEEDREKGQEEEKEEEREKRQEKKKEEDRERGQEEEKEEDREKRQEEQKTEEKEKGQEEKKEEDREKRQEEKKEEEREKVQEEGKEEEREKGQEEEKKEKRRKGQEEEKKEERRKGQEEEKKEERRKGQEAQKEEEREEEKEERTKEREEEREKDQVEDRETDCKEESAADVDKLTELEESLRNPHTDVDSSNQEVKTTSHTDDKESSADAETTPVRESATNSAINTDLISDADLLALSELITPGGAVQTPSGPTTLSASSWNPNGAQKSPGHASTTTHTAAQFQDIPLGGAIVEEEPLLATKVEPLTDAPNRNLAEGTKTKTCRCCAIM